MTTPAGKQIANVALVLDRIRTENPRIRSPLDLVDLSCRVVEDVNASLSPQERLYGSAKKKTAMQLLVDSVMPLEQRGYLEPTVAQEAKALSEDLILLGGMVDSLIEIWNRLAPKSAGLWCCMP